MKNRSKPLSHTATQTTDFVAALFRQCADNPLLLAAEDLIAVPSINCSDARYMAHVLREELCLIRTSGPVRRRHAIVENGAAGMTVVVEPMPAHRPFVFPRSAFQSNPGREATTSDTMSKKLQTKAELVNMITNLEKQLNYAANTQAGMQIRLDQDAHDMKVLKDQVAAHEQSYAALLDSYKAEKNVVAATEERHRVLAAELNDVKADRDNWRRDYLAMHAEFRRMRKEFFTQARLAGVLADEATVSMQSVNLSN